MADCFWMASDWLKKRLVSLFQHMMIATMLAAMAAWNTTTTPRTQTASGSTEPGRHDNPGYRARAPDIAGVLNHNHNNNISADSNSLQLTLGQGDRAGLGDQRGTCPWYVGETKDPPAERRKPRREQGATLPWGASKATHAKTQHPAGPRRPGAVESTRELPPDQSPRKHAPRRAHRGHHGAQQDSTAQSGDMLNRHAPEGGPAREEGREAKLEREATPPH